MIRYYHISLSYIHIWKPPHPKFRNSCDQLLILLSIVEEALLRIHLSSQSTKEGGGSSDFCSYGLRRFNWDNGYMTGIFSWDLPPGIQTWLAVQFPKEMEDCGEENHCSCWWLMPSWHCSGFCGPSDPPKEKKKN